MSDRRGRLRLAPTAERRFGAMGYRLFLATMAVAAGVLVHGFYQPPLPQSVVAWLGALGAPWQQSAHDVYVALVRVLQYGALVLYWIDVMGWPRRSTVSVKREDIAGQRPNWFDWVLMGLTVLGGFVYLTDSPRLGWLLVEVVAGVLAVSELWRLNVTLSRSLKRPGILLPLSFLTLIAVGTPLLKLPVAVPQGTHLSWLDALFTMTSAVCVTGLGVRDTARDFTPFGQTVIAVFIQLGGLGIIIFGSTLAMLLGRNLSLRENLSLSQMLSDQPLRKLTNFVRFIVVTTVAIELLGALLLYPLWEPPDGQTYSMAQRWGLSLFHSVSAFCNAGFDLFGDSFSTYRRHPLPYAIIMPLIVIGGLGFPVLRNVVSVARFRMRSPDRRPSDRAAVDLSQRRLTLHTKVTLWATVILFVVGVVGIGAGQLVALASSPSAGWATTPTQTVTEAMGDAVFMSVSARTAGFYTLDVQQMQPAGRFTIMTLMCVGGSPGSTAGGVKTTVIALLVLSVVANIRQRDETEAFGRAIADSLVRKAGTLSICYAALIVTSTGLLALSESFAFEQILFEVISAATTTGLTLGITADLSVFGKCVIIATMFLGRVGPLALLGALMLSSGKRRPYRFAHEDVILG